MLSEVRGGRREGETQETKVREKGKEMAMAATAAVQQVAVLVGVAGVSVGTSGESGGGQYQGMRGGGLQVSPRAHLVSARPAQSHQTHPAHPRLAAFSSFFGAGLDPCLPRASNVSLRFVSNHPPFACPCIAKCIRTVRKYPEEAGKDKKNCSEHVGVLPLPAPCKFLSAFLYGRCACP